MTWILIGIGIGIAILNIANSIIRDNKVLAAVADSGLDVRRTIQKGSPEYLELISLLKQCRKESLTIEEAAEKVIRSFA